jgi:hypothetical protein
MVFIILSFIFGIFVGIIISTLYIIYKEDVVTIHKIEGSERKYVIYKGKPWDLRYSRRKVNGL